MNNAIPMRVNKAAFLKDSPIYFDVIDCSVEEGKLEVYSPLLVNALLEIVVVTSGRGSLKVVGQVIPYEEGDVFLMPSYIPHEYCLSEDSERFSARRFLFDPEDWLDKDAAVRESPGYCYGVFFDNSIIACARLNTDTLNKTNSLLDEIVAELSERKNEWRSAVSAHLSLLLITLGRYVSNTIQNIGERQKGESRLVSIAVGMIMDSYDDRALTLGTVADALYVSQSSLSRIFKHYTGETFSQYLRNVRLNRAGELLRSTLLTIDEIMERCGLKDIVSFYHNFSSYAGMTPHQYRTENQKSNIKNNDIEDRIMVIMSEISENLQKGKAKIVKELVQQAIDEGSNPEQILNEGLLAGMNVIGEKFKNNEIYVPEVLVAARAMNMGAQILKPYLVANGVVATGRVCIGTVQGDLHDIGKNIVKMMMEGKGLEVVDLGTDVAAETFVKTAIEQNCQVICCSALLTTTMNVMEEVVKAAEAAGIRDKVKIMVGGAPVNEDFCKKIGADCYTVDAASAADAAAEFCKA